jgi:hypothetical protein
MVWRKTNLAACQRILCAGRSSILAKKEVFLKIRNNVKGTFKVFLLFENQR